VSLNKRKPKRQSADKTYKYKFLQIVRLHQNILKLSEIYLSNSIIHSVFSIPVELSSCSENEYEDSDDSEHIRDLRWAL